ncbi:peptidoglycan-binding protein [Flavobacteriaceae bacterium]|nr:peptidoglycan-binding protein [Flavobacteriaceae bacterium]
MKKLFILLFIPFIVLSQDYDRIYNDVRKIPYKKYNSIIELHNIIIKPYYSDVEKVYAFAKFITDKIAYGERARTPLNCINSGEGVCQDYSELFQELCEISGIENNFVTGMGSSGIEDYGVYNSNHAWNVVKLNGKYMIFDLTWAAGGGSGDNFSRIFKPKYFNPKPEDFIRDHFPDDSKWQLLDQPVSKKDFIYKPFYDSEFENLSLKNGVVKNSKLQITFNSTANFNDATLFKWKLNEYGSASGKSLDFTKNGNFYKTMIEESISGAYRYKITFKNDECTDIDGDGTLDSYYSCPEIMFILVTPGYLVEKPSSYDKNDPWGLIESYHYVFYKNDFSFFKELNPQTNISSLKNIKYSQSLSKSLTDWYGNYRRFYTNMRNGDIYYKIDNFMVVLSFEEDGYEFKELQIETLRLGKSGFGVKELQRIFGLEENGDFDNILELEIKKIQKINGLKADGIVGKMTYQVLGM